MSDFLERADINAMRVLHLNQPDSRDALDFALVLNLQAEFAAAAVLWWVKRALRCALDSRKR